MSVVVDEQETSVPCSHKLYSRMCTNFGAHFDFTPHFSALNVDFQPGNEAAVSAVFCQRQTILQVSNYSSDVTQPETGW